MNDAMHAVTEPQHEGNLESRVEHGREWVTCLRCGRQWSVQGSVAEVVSEGDGYCDDEVS